MMQEAYVWWWVVAIALVGLELTSGTFYLLVYGLAAAAGGVVAWLGGGWVAQLVVAGLVAAAGTVALNHWRRSTAHPESTVQDMDLGQGVTVLQWNGQAGQVRYRGTEWDAKAESANVDPAQPLYIRAIQGNTLVLGN